MTVTIPKIRLAPREREVVEGMADGSTLTEVAADLLIKPGTASGYLKLAKTKLHGMREIEAAIAVGYATNTITHPDALDPDRLTVPKEQLDLVPLIGQGKTSAQIAVELKRGLGVIRCDEQDLLANLGARNRAHAIKRAWQYRILTAQQVIAWLR
ncbi:LuxR C-terminal-related transcriptional regulator [Streptomyces sp. NPDC059010]|uniref:LuxR C-terminal-related transcriptional regulator n=1 Tax=Streptomyces sp. NPDC059010 TaxID=3346695 RepID=UPI0036A796E7